jgi:CBS domain-containing protein
VITSFDILGMTYFGRFSEDTEFIKNTRIEKLVKEQKLISFSPDQTVRDALEVVAEKNIRTLPIVEGKKLVGVVSIVDLVKVILSGGDTSAGD